MVQIRKRPLPKALPDFPGLHPVLRRIYAARGVQHFSELDKGLKALPSFETLLGIDQAVTRIEHAIRHQQTMMIIGDFDADGATSTALAVSALKTLGADQVLFLVPNRFVYGYGLTPDLVDLAAKSHPDVLITVDNGITSIEGVERANALGIDVIITDHHLPGDDLPAACAIVNPNQKGDAFPSKSLAGVGVIFYVMLRLRKQLQQTGWFEQQQQTVPNMAQFLDLVALGTVADVVPLDQVNRTLVFQGLQRMQQGLVRPGIRALIEVAGKELAHLRASDLGFSVAPRLNAAGRLDDMTVGITCLLTESHETAQTLACHLDNLNDERRLIEQEMRSQAIQVLHAVTSTLDQANLPAGLCLQDKGWHQGVIGILAGRLKELYYRPVFVFAQVNDTELKGSGRSVADVNLRDVLAQINQDHPGLITKFGGHAMAAGMSLLPEHFQIFKTCFEQEIAKHRSIEHCKGEFLIDGSLTTEELTLDLARLIQAEGPWGSHFPEPLFEGNFIILQQRLVGQKHLKLTLRAMDQDKLIDAIAFNINSEQWPNERIRSLRVVYTLDVNHYQGRSRLQLIVHHLEAAPIEETAVSV